MGVPAFPSRGLQGLRSRLRQGQNFPAKGKFAGLITNFNTRKELHMLARWCSKIQAGQICVWEEKFHPFAKIRLG